MPLICQCIPFMYAFLHLNATIPMYISMFPLIPYVPHMTWGHMYTAYILGSFWGASVHQSGISVSFSTSIFLAVHNSHTSCSPSLWVASLLDWIPMVVCYASCCCSFLFSVFTMSQSSTIMAMTTTPLVTVLCFLYVICPFSGYYGSSLMGLPATLGQDDVVLLPSQTPRHSGGVVGLATVQQHQPQSQMPLQAYTNYAMGPP